jgi:Flp pilus assembly protein TadG
MRSHTHCSRRFRGQWGSMTVELVLLTPVLMLFILLAIGAGRYELAREQVVGAARSGAEAASVVPGPYEAQPAAESAVASDLAGVDNTCGSVQALTDTTEFRPGGSVRVTVRCRIDFGSLLVPGLPGSTTVTVTRSAPIDPYRSVQ